jgi:hypothetical protein
MKLRDSIALSESGFVFNPVNGESFTLNETGSRILQLMKEGHGQKEIIEKIGSEYQSDASKVEKDVEEFFDLLQRYQLTD